MQTQSHMQSAICMAAHVLLFPSTLPPPLVRVSFPTHPRPLEPKVCPLRSTKYSSRQGRQRGREEDRPTDRQGERSRQRQRENKKARW